MVTIFGHITTPLKTLQWICKKFYSDCLWGEQGLGESTVGEILTLHLALSGLFTINVHC